MRCGCCVLRSRVCAASCGLPRWSLVLRCAPNLALQAEIHVQRERATTAESKATQLEARIVDLKAELDRALKQLDAERQAASGAQKEAQAAALEGASLKGELAALRGAKK